MKKIAHPLLLAAALATPLLAAAMDDVPPPARGPHADERRGPPHPGLTEGEELPGPERFGPRGRPGPGFAAAFDHVSPYLRGIELTDAQEDKIFALVHAQVPYLREQMKARAKAERGLAELHGAANYDDAAAAKLAQAAAQAEANVTLAQLRTERKVLAVLTAEQRKALDERRPGRPGGR